ncbi:MAG: phage tail protein [Bacteroidota bacterium]
MAFEYPQVGFSFRVIFEIVPQFKADMEFQEVSGLSVEMEMETRAEAGENRFVHHLPVRSKYGDVTLKRGKFLDSGLLHWCRQALENFDFRPANVLIMLLDAEGLPLYNWQLINAIPLRLEVSPFNAERSELVIETLVLKYQYFNYFDPVSATLDAAANITASLDVNIGL